jgi:hypothetical protein
VEINAQIADEADEADEADDKKSIAKKREEFTDIENNKNILTGRSTSNGIYKFRTIFLYRVIIFYTIRYKKWQIYQK